MDSQVRLKLEKSYYIALALVLVKTVVENNLCQLCFGGQMIVNLCANLRLIRMNTSHCK